MLWQGFISLSSQDLLALHIAPQVIWETDIVLVIAMLQHATGTTASVVVNLFLVFSCHFVLGAPCDTGCLNIYLGNDFCNEACNTYNCNWDGTYLWCRAVNF